MLFGRKLTGRGGACLRRGIKKVVLALLFVLLSLSLSGCMSQLEEREMTDVSQIPIDAGVNAPVEDTIADSSEWVTLYFFSEDETRLLPAARKIDVPGGVSVARAALEALLAGPLDTEEGTWPDLGLPIVARSLEISNGIAIVDLPARVRTLPQKTLYGMRMAMANTLTELPDVQAVNVLIGGARRDLTSVRRCPWARSSARQI